MKILVAEDDELYSGLYDRMLTKWGYSFDLVYDGKEAVEHAVENEAARHIPASEKPASNADRPNPPGRQGDLLRSQ